MEFSGSGFWLCSMYGISLQMNAIVSAAGSFISANQKQFTILKCNAQQKQKEQKKIQNRKRFSTTKQKVVLNKCTFFSVCLIPPTHAMRSRAPPHLYRLMKRNEKKQQQKVIVCRIIGSFQSHFEHKK